MSASNRMDAAFATLKEKNEAALVAFVTAGDPWSDIARTADLIVRLAHAGADIIELGVPYSDPQADGPTVQAASQRALEAGVNMDFVLDVVRTVRKTSEVPILLMTYYNPALRYGLARFASALNAVGVDGVIMTDLPPEEAAPWLAEADSRNIANVFLLAPTSTPRRIESVANVAKRGFVYCVSRTGVTGAKRDAPTELAELIDRIRKATQLPVCVGFGISTPEHVATVSSFADGAVIGSALVDFLHNSANRPYGKEEMAGLVSSWKNATRRGQ